MSTNIPNINRRISEIRDKFCQNSNKIFAEKLGISTSRASNLCNTEPNIGKATIEKILTAFPQVSRAWLMLGDGYMLTEDNINTNHPSLSLPSEHNNKNARAHESNNVVIDASVWRVIEQQAASLASKDEQVSELITLLKKQITSDPLTTPSDQEELLEQ